MKKIDSKGFTLIELLLATVFISFIFLTITYGYVQVNRTYTKGALTKRVNETGRVVLDEISRNIRTSSASGIEFSAPSAPLGGRICIGTNIRYAWSTPTVTENFDPATDGAITLYKAVGSSGCTDSVNKGAAATEISNLIDDDIEVQEITLTPVGSSSTYSLRVVLSSRGENVDFDGEKYQCSALGGSESYYCAVSDLTTIVTSRN